MPKIHDCLQGSDEWLALRMGRVTASELDRIVDSKFEQRTGDGPKTYLYEKVAEAYRGKPLPGFSSWQTEEGQALEDEARRFVAMEFVGKHRIHNCGFITTDDDAFGCSPDALMDDDGGLELKAPQVTNHVRYVLDGKLPKDYAAQVHGSLFATGRAWWTFCSYRRHFPPFILRVERDEAICSKIAEAVAAFTLKFNAALAKLKAQ